MRTSAWNHKTSPPHPKIIICDSKSSSFHDFSWHLDINVDHATVGINVVLIQRPHATPRLNVEEQRVGGPFNHLRSRLSTPLSLRKRAKLVSFSPGTALAGPKSGGWCRHRFETAFSPVACHLRNAKLPCSVALSVNSSLLFPLLPSLAATSPVTTLAPVVTILLAIASERVAAAHGKCRSCETIREVDLCANGVCEV